jgi:hypothetical protein
MQIYIFEFLFQKQFPKCRESFLERLELDGYNSELKVAFEYQGIQHFEVVPHWGNKAKFDAIQQRDKRKREICTEEKITLIEIPYQYDFSNIPGMAKYIEGQLDEKLGQLFVYTGCIKDHVAIKMGLPEENKPQCEYCGTISANKKKLYQHQKNAKFCVENRKKLDGTEIKDLSPEALCERIETNPDSISYGMYTAHARKLGISFHGDKRELLTRIGRHLRGIISEKDGKTQEEEKDPSMNLDNLPRGINPVYELGQMIGFRTKLAKDGYIHEGNFTSKKKSMESKFREAWLFRKYLIEKYDLTEFNNQTAATKQPSRSGVCSKCGKAINRSSTLCGSCVLTFKKEQPSKEALISIIAEHKGNLASVGRFYERTGDTVRSWLKSYGFTQDQIKARSFG